MKESFIFRVFTRLFTLFVMAAATFAQAPSRPFAIIPRDAEVSDALLNFL